MGLSLSESSADYQVPEVAEFESLAALCDEFLCIFGEDGTLEYANKSFLMTFGYDAAELTSLSIFGLTHPDDRERTRNAFGLDERNSSIRDFEHRWLDKNGGYRRLKWRARYQPPSKRICAIGQPADESIQDTQVSSIRNVKFSRYAMDNAVDPVYWIDSQGRNVYVNAAACKSLGYTHEEMLELSVPDYDPLFPRDDWDESFRKFASGELTNFETVHRRKDGQEFPVELSLSVVEADGDQFICVFVHDISERKRDARIMQQLRFAADNSIDAVYIYRIDARILYVNESACNSLGYSRKELLNMTIFDLDPALTKETWMWDWNHRRAGNNQALESQHYRKDGSIMPVEIAVSLTEIDGVEYSCAFVRDISERKQSIRHMEQLQFAIENAADAIFICSIDGSINYANEGACRSLGYSQDELQSMTILDIDPDYSVEAVQVEQQKARLKGNRTLESRHRRKDGSFFPVEVTFNIKSFDGEDYACNIVRDISERKASAKQTEELLFAIENAIDAVYIYTEDGVVSYANKAASTALGYSPDELKNLTIHDLMPEDRRKYWREIWKQGRAGTFRTLTSKHRRKDGTYYPIEISFGVKEFEGMEYACAFVRDITERKAASRQMEELRLAVENANDAVYLYGDDFKIYYANKAACDALGYSLEELTNMAVYDLDVNFQMTELEKLRALVRANELKPLETLHRRKDGSLLPVEISAVIADFEGAEYSAAFARDISERKKAEAQLSEYQEHLEELVRSRTAELEIAQQALVRKEKLAVLGQLTGIVAHELRNPLGTIRSSLYLLKTKLQSPTNDVTRALGRAERNIIRCDKIIDELLDYTRTRPLNSLPVMLNDWLTGLVDEYEFAPEIEVQTEFGPDSKVQIEPDRFRRCVVNLLSNACEAMLEDASDKPKLLRIQTRLEAEDIEIAIEDTGIGIPEDKLKNIFEPLYSSKGFGVGLGLAVVEQVMKQHKGSVSVDSTEGKGTRVALKLPLNAKFSKDGDDNRRTLRVDPTGKV